MKFERMLCFGDSITLGCNDSRGLGWPGRLGRGRKRGERHLAVYNLGSNGDTSLDIALRAVSVIRTLSSWSLSSDNAGSPHT